MCVYVCTLFCFILFYYLNMYVLCSDPVVAVAWHPEGTKIASSSKNSILIWN